MNERTGGGRVAAIYLTDAEGGAPRSRESARALQGAGLEGDRYEKRRGTFSKKKLDPGQQITLIESEAVEKVIADGVDIGQGRHRRNVETSGLRLNDLVGKTFQVGEATLLGHRLCHPCGYLAKKIGADMVSILENAGGLRAEIVSGGEIRVGDSIVI
ncbi:MAG: MOSC domain-containing protein [Gemmatimonadetes bacterium]|nr:MOSC domain-containing protein [Gemmatimonadota bacterium]